MNILTENVVLDLLGIIIAAIIGVITFFKWRFSYWRKKGVPTLNPVIPFGDAKELFVGPLSMAPQFAQYYKAFKSKGLRHGGIFLGAKPFYVPVEPNLIKNILQTDFSHFVNRGAFVDEENDPLNAHLAILGDSKWKNLRTKLTPTFTSGKMKMMFQTLADCTFGLKEVLDKYATSNTSVDIKDVLGRFSTDVIASVAFGLECNSLKDPTTDFRKYGRRIFEIDSWRFFKMVFQFVVPHPILKFLKMKSTPDDVEAFFMKMVKATVDYREQNNIYRKDFMHLLLQLKNRGIVSDDDKISDETGKFCEKALTINQLAAQAYVFFLAGFETSSTTMTFAFLELAQNQDVQEKLRTEINGVLAKHEDKLTYEGIMEMHYLDKVIRETLRKLSPAGLLVRICTKDYTIPGTDILLEKGTNVGISVDGLHYDPEFYPEPEKFDPERFSEENKKLRPAIAWLPFGEGPRVCIGMRFGLMQTKVGIAAILRNFRVTLGKKTQLPIKLKKNNIVTTVKGGVWIDMEKIY